MAMLVGVLHQPASSRNSGFLGVYAAGKVMFDLRVNETHDTSLPLTRILMALAALAIVEINPPVGKMCPTNSGKM